MIRDTDKPSATDLSTLRQRALGCAPVADTLEPIPLTPQAMQALVHELQVHQIELEMQNEQLRQSQMKLEETHQRYLDLYELAPVGYCTTNAQGQIISANLTAAAMLGVPRAKLLHIPFTRFIARDDQDNFFLLRNQLQHTNPTQTAIALDLRMVRPGATPFGAHLSITIQEDAQQRIVLCH